MQIMTYLDEERLDLQEMGMLLPEEESPQTPTSTLKKDQNIGSGSLKKTKGKETDKLSSSGD